MGTIRCLSLWQPHAQAIALGLKPYETRGWSTSYRGPLAIHSAKKLFNYKDYSLDYYQEVGQRFKEVDFPLFALDYGIVQTMNLRGRIGRKEFWGELPRQR